MPCRVKLMPLAFSASQKLDLTVRKNAERLPTYLQQEGRVLAALLDARQIEHLSPGHYRYLLADLQVFQLVVGMDQGGPATGSVSLDLEACGCAE